MNIKETVYSDSSATTLSNKTMATQSALKNSPSNHKIWACWLHLSFNFASGLAAKLYHFPVFANGYRTEFEPEQSVWDAAIKKMAEQNINMVVINLDDSVLWHSHPEIALRNSWTPERLREELAKIRALGIEPIPCLNFSACHHAWLGDYSKMVSTQPYYQVCKDLIGEAIEIFDTPRFIHFGMDEEIYENQKDFDYIVIRKNDQWWGDLYFYFAEAMKRGVRPWVWSEYVYHPDTFLKMMPKYAVQSNYWYSEDVDPKHDRVKAYLDLSKEGYDQIPTASNDAIIWTDKSNNKCIGNTVDFCSHHIDNEHLLGFLQSSWMPTIEKFRPNIIQTIELTGEARRKYESK